MQKPLKIALVVVAMLVAIRIALPYVVLHYANRSLAGMAGYRGHIHDIDLALIRGAYKIDSIYINKVDTATRQQVPFFSASVIDLSVEWKALFHGSVVGELVFENPVLRFTRDKVEPRQVRNDSSGFRKLLRDFMPLQVNRFEIKKGDVRYVDETSNPRVDVRLTDLNAVAHNLRNSYDSSAVLPASITAGATLYEGSLTFNMALDPLADPLAFDMNTEVKNTNLVLLNDFFQAYAGVDVNRGTFGMYTEVAAKEGSYTGYIKPLIKDLDVLGKEDRNDNIFQKLWEGLAGTAGEIFENQPRGQVASKIPFEGQFDNTNTNLWVAIGNILQNAFIRAIQPAIDNEINIGSVDEEKEKEDRNILEKIFGPKDEKDKNKKDGDGKTKN